MGSTRRARPEAPERGSSWRARRAVLAAGTGLTAIVLVVALLALTRDQDAVGQEAGPPADTSSTIVRPRATTTSTTTATSSTTTTSLPARSTSAPAPPPIDAPTTTAAARTAPPAAVACVAAPLPPRPVWGPDPSRYDPATVQQTPDPAAPGCGRRRLLVVGDSTGRGVANALRRSALGDVEVWDRTEHGCGMVAPRPECAGWRSVWEPAVASIDPDVVVVVLGASGDLVTGQDPPFNSAAATALRRTEAGRVLDVLASRGARIVWVLPAVPLPEASFFCGGRITDTPCDPAWVDRWHADIGAIAAARRVPTIDLRRWVVSRPGPPLRDRPDGLHLTGPALDAQAAWLLERIRPNG